jgi:hypothetical protein
MLHAHLIDGAPDEPDEDDLDAICAGPRPSLFFPMLFKEVAGFALPEPTVISDNEDPVRRIRTGWSGNQTLGLEVTVMECPETTAFPVYCYYETHGLPGMTVKWNYALHYKGQLGHVVYRNGTLECMFETETDQQRFAAIWRRAIAKEPVFEPFPLGSDVRGHGCQ